MSWLSDGSILASGDQGLHTRAMHETSLASAPSPRETWRLDRAALLPLVREQLAPHSAMVSS